MGLAVINGTSCFCGWVRFNISLPVSSAYRITMALEDMGRVARDAASKQNGANRGSRRYGGGGSGWGSSLPPLWKAGAISRTPQTGRAAHRPFPRLSPAQAPFGAVARGILRGIMDRVGVPLSGWYGPGRLKSVHQPVPPRFRHFPRSSAAPPAANRLHGDWHRRLRG
jgi:hypothetical protein